MENLFAQKTGCFGNKISKHSAVNYAKTTNCAPTPYSPLLTPLPLKRIPHS